MRPVRSLPRRKRGALVALLGVAVLLTGCGSTPPEPAAPPPDPSGAFPVTIETAFGPVTVPEQPQRVVALGWSDAETALALGVEPVGAADWLPVGGDGLGPWAKEAGLSYRNPPKMLGTTELDLEEVAALEPDLILDTRSSGDPARHERLSALGVPVVGVPAGAAAYMTPWQDQLAMIGQALGRTEEADRLRAELDAEFRRAAEANPAFQDATAVVAARSTSGYGAYVNGDVRVDFLRALGFRNSPAVQDLAAGNFFVPISNERLGLLDADLTVATAIGVDSSEITSDPLFQAVPSVRAGRSVVLDDPTVSQAFASASVHGLSYALDAVVPRLAEAMAP
ncbi:iron-siderophore ABC transporter substrate-binding protein [Saccharopolyspora sp. CA-218241]|uniref:iron-siderophore ABC transporter substrate-binding protein n=1 Tax=Saccharopolyspora sp. CA-218241 TaxID=3240027 RepID=UPI003D96F809